MRFSKLCPLGIFPLCSLLFSSRCPGRSAAFLCFLAPLMSSTYGLCLSILRIRPAWLVCDLLVFYLRPVSFFLTGCSLAPLFSFCSFSLPVLFPLSPLLSPFLLRWPALSSLFFPSFGPSALPLCLVSLLCFDDLVRTAAKASAFIPCFSRNFNFLGVSPACFSFSLWVFSPCLLLFLL